MTQKPRSFPRCRQSETGFGTAERCSDVLIWGTVSWRQLQINWDLSGSSIRSPVRSRGSVCCRFYKEKNNVYFRNIPSPRGGCMFIHVRMCLRRGTFFGNHTAHTGEWPSHTQPYKLPPFCYFPWEQKKGIRSSSALSFSLCICLLFSVPWWKISSMAVGLLSVLLGTIPQ